MLPSNEPATFQNEITDTLLPLSVFRICVQPAGAVTVVAEPPSDRDPGHQEVAIDVDVGFGITRVVAPEFALVTDCTLVPLELAIDGGVGFPYERAKP